MRCGRGERTTAALVARAGRRAHTAAALLVTSFDPAALLIVRERLPRVPLGLLTWTRFPLRKAIPAARHLGLEVVVANVESFLAEDAGAGRAQARTRPAWKSRRGAPRPRSARRCAQPASTAS